MPDAEFIPLNGGCACSSIRYKVTASPLIIQCCHCHKCQRKTGSAFVLNAMIESRHCELAELNNDTVIPTPSLIPPENGAVQNLVRCSKCQVTVWSHFSGGPVIAFFRVGTLDPESKARLWKNVEENEWQMVHIYTESKVPWVIIPEGDQSFEKYYDTLTVWSKESLERREALMPDIIEHRNRQKENTALVDAEVTK